MRFWGQFAISKALYQSSIQPFLCICNNDCFNFWKVFARFLLFFFSNVIISSLSIHLLSILLLPDSHVLSWLSVLCLDVLHLITSGPNCLLSLPSSVLGYICPESSTGSSWFLLPLAVGELFSDGLPVCWQVDRWLSQAKGQLHW